MVCCGFICQLRTTVPQVVDFGPVGTVCMSCGGQMQAEGVVVKGQDGRWAVPIRQRPSRFSTTRNSTNTMRTFCTHRHVFSFCSRRMWLAIIRISWWDKNWFTDLFFKPLNELIHYRCRESGFATCIKQVPFRKFQKCLQPPLDNVRQVWRRFQKLLDWSIQMPLNKKINTNV